MKKILFFLLLGEVLIHNAKAQYVQSPTSYAYKAVEGRNALQGPRGCGKPADSVKRFYAPDTTAAAYYVDTCNNVFYYFNSKTQTWETITAGTSGIGAVYAGDCLIKVNDSTLALNPACGIDTAFALNDSTLRFCKADNTCWDIRNGTSLITYEGDTITINNTTINKNLKIPRTDTTNANKGCGKIIYDTILEHYFGDVCINGVHYAWQCFDCTGISNITGFIEAGQYVNISGTGTLPDPYIINAEDSNAFHTTHQISDTCFLIRRPDGTEDTVCISGGTASGCGNISVSVNGGTPSYPDGACNIDLTSEQLPWHNLFSVALGAAGGSPAGPNNFTYTQITGRATGWTIEAGVQFVLSEDCTISNLYVRTSTTQSATGDLTITLRKNGLNTALTLTIPAGSVAGTFSNTTDQVSITAGDIIDWQSENDATATGATLISIGATAIGQ